MHHVRHRRRGLRETACLTAWSGRGLPCPRKHRIHCGLDGRAWHGDRPIRLPCGKPCKAHDGQVDVGGEQMVGQRADVARQAVWLGPASTSAAWPRSRHPWPWRSSCLDRNGPVSRKGWLDPGRLVRGAAAVPWTRARGNRRRLEQPRSGRLALPARLTSCRDLGCYTLPMRSAHGMDDRGRPAKDRQWLQRLRASVNERRPPTDQRSTVCLRLGERSSALVVAMIGSVTLAKRGTGRRLTQASDGRSVRGRR
jgi:hypothetical protein